MSNLDFEVVKSSDSFAVTKLTTNERLNSPNIGNWDPDVRLLQSSDKWIGVCHPVFFHLYQIETFDDLK